MNKGKSFLSGTLLIILIFVAGLSVNAQSWGEKMAATVTRVWGDTINLRANGPIHWTYDRGVITKGLENVWYNTGNPAYYNTIKTSMDAFVQEDGSIKGYKMDEYNIDHILTGRSLLMLYKVTGQKKYYQAAESLRRQLDKHPRTKEGGFWHKKRYEWQMWLDGLYMGQPFYAEWAATFHEPAAFDDIANQFVWMEKHSIDEKTGLLYHGWDESKQQAWANKETGKSPHFWGRAMGWYGMALVDVLQYFPESHPRQKELVAILNRLAQSVTSVQDKPTGLWWDIMNLPNYKNNYLEASASCMLTYTLAKGVRFGWLPDTYTRAANKGFKGILDKFIKTEPNGDINLDGTVSVSGLGGNPDSYRDGSFEYYMSEKVIRNDPKGVGAFIKCATEMELLPTQKLGKNKTLALDYFYNHEIKTDITGTPVQWHYTLDEMDHGGFAMLGHIFNKHGVKVAPLREEPNAQNLADKAFYLIVDPDNAKETKNPNYLGEPAISAIYDWVKAGGVLVVLANDSANCDLPHTNLLTQKFGITLNNKGRNFVKNDVYEQGLVQVPPKHKVFPNVQMLFIKEISTLSIQKPAKALLTAEEDVIMAQAKVGKGSVFVLGDPWLYNEYVDGRKLPMKYQSYQAMNDWVKWVTKQSRKK